MLRKVSLDHEYYFIDDQGCRQGEFVKYYIDEYQKVHIRCQYVDDQLVGPHRMFNRDGSIQRYCNYNEHGWHGEIIRFDQNNKVIYNGYYVDHKEVHNFIISPLDDIEKMILVLKYGAPLLPKEELLCYKK